MNLVVFHSCIASIPFMTPNGAVVDANPSQREMNIKISDVQSRHSTIGISVAFSEPGARTKHVFVVREALRDICSGDKLAPLQNFLMSSQGALEPLLRQQLKDSFVKCILSRLYLNWATEKPCINKNKFLTNAIPEQSEGPGPEQPITPRPGVSEPLEPIAHPEMPDPGEWTPTPAVQPSTIFQVPDPVVEPNSTPGAVVKPNSTPGVSDPVVEPNSTPGEPDPVVKPNSTPGVPDPVVEPNSTPEVPDPVVEPNSTPEVPDPVVDTNSHPRVLGPVKLNPTPEVPDPVEPISTPGVPGPAKPLPPVKIMGHGQMELLQK